MANIRTLLQNQPNIRSLGMGGSTTSTMRYILGDGAIVGGQVWTLDTSTGLPGTLTQFNFVTAGYTAPATVNDLTKGALLFSLFNDGPIGSTPNIVVAGAPLIARDVPLQLFTGNDALIPWLQYTAQQAGTYRARLVFRKNGQPDITDEWVETWVSP